jgi:hypothetical protein
MSNLENFTTQISSLISSLVLHPLVDWLSVEKKVSVTVDELLEVLKVPKVTKPPLSTLTPIFTPTVTKTSMELNRPSDASSQRSSKSSLQTTQPVPKPPSPVKDTGFTCKYVFKRGELKGKECGKPVTEGKDFCDQCSSKKGSKVSDVKQTKVVETTTSGGTKSSSQSLGFTSPLSKKTEKPKIELRETGQPNTYMDIQTNIVVKKVVEKDKTLYVAVGIQEESGFRTLTEDEKKEALKRNFSLSVSDGKNESSEGKVQDKKIVSRQPVKDIPDIDSDDE